MSKKTKDNRWKDIFGGSAFMIPVALLRHPNFTRLTPAGNKLMMDLARQYSGHNNGYLCAAWSLMKENGWKSPSTLRAAMLECEHYRLIVRSRQGGRNMPTLHAFTWRRVDEKSDKHLDMRPTTSPSNAWLSECEPFRKPARKAKATYRKAA